MSTYKDLQDKINLDYLNQMTLIPETKRAIASAIRCYEGRRFWFNETATSTVLVAGQSYLAVPSDFLFLDRLEVTDGGINPLIQTSFNTIREMNLDYAQGPPTHFAYRANRFALAMTPNLAYTATIQYVHSLPTLSAESDTNAWTNEAFNLIAHAATLDLMTGVLQVPDPRKINHHARAVEMALNELHMRNENRLSNRLTPTYF